MAIEAVDFDKLSGEVETVHVKLIAELHRLRAGNVRHPIVRFFVDDHILHVVRRLESAYAALALTVPHTHQFHSWLVAAKHDLDDLAQQLPSRAPLATGRYLLKPMLWLFSGGGLAVLGLKLSNVCLCYLAKASYVLVPACVACLLVPGSRQARARIQAMSLSHEQRLAKVLDLPLRREMPWDILGMAATAVWFFGAPWLFRHIATFNDMIFVLGALASCTTVGLLVQWVGKGGAQPSCL